MVKFAIEVGRATFNRSRTLTVTTNLAGRAAVTGLTPTGAGTLHIAASAAFQGQTAVATIVQTNVMTMAQAATVGAAGGSSSGTTAAGSAAGGGTGGGVSATTLGIIGGAVAGGVVVATKVIGGSGGDTGGGSEQSPTRARSPFNRSTRTAKS